MHRTSITEALLGTAVLFNTVFHMPEEHILSQIFSWLVDVMRSVVLHSMDLLLSNCLTLLPAVLLLPTVRD